MREVDTADLAMMRRARNREQVLFLHRDNTERPVTLICWQGRAGRNRCRIEHPSGKQTTVQTHLVRPI